MFPIDYSTQCKSVKKQIQKTNIDVKIKNFDECKIKEIMLRTTKHENEGTCENKIEVR